jgi:hypothetical protein
MTDEELPLKLDLQLIRDNLPKYSPTKLCELIAVARYFSMDQQIAIMCMQELAGRREAGDTFDFEAYIEQAYQQLPPLNFAMPDIRFNLQQVINAYRNKK